MHKQTTQNCLNHSSNKYKQKCRIVQCLKRPFLILLLIWLQCSHSGAFMGDLLVFGLCQKSCKRPEGRNPFGAGQMLLANLFTGCCLSIRLCSSAICQSTDFGIDHKFCAKWWSWMARIFLHSPLCSRGLFVSHCWFNLLVQHASRW